MDFKNTAKFAKELDQQDVLRDFRKLFYFPLHRKKEALYFVGNSLGLQPASTTKYIEQELKDWADFAVEGHFQAKNPWFKYHEIFAKPLAKIVGAKPHEVVAMNALSVNLHLLLASFYQPSPKRHQILCESRAFPSDQYILESHVDYRGYDPRQSIIEIPTTAKGWISEETILRHIEKHHQTITLLMMGGVNYITGQVFDMKAITQKAHEYGIIVGFDLAHAVGNVELKLHDWGVDFAAWCSYKYLNSGPGGVGGVYIHERHARNTKLPRLAGWWGYDSKSRFLMEKGFKAMPSAEGWQLSNAPVLSMAAHKASLDIFMKAGMPKLRKKSLLLTAYLEYVLQEAKKHNAHIDFNILTPSKVQQRGCQLSVVFKNNGKKIFRYLSEKGIMADWREPNVIRFAPVPLYNSFTDVYLLGQALKGYK